MDTKSNVKTQRKPRLTHETIKKVIKTNAYEDATKEPYGYLLIDLRPETDDRYRIRTKIFPDDERQYAYLPKV